MSLAFVVYICFELCLLDCSISVEHVTGARKFTCVVCIVQMDAYNLSIMFGPALVRPKDDTVVNMLKDMADQGQIVENLIRYVSVYLTRS